ncbi:EAL domain-containing protein [Shewanella avicenniae]|uniref:EAL domain-containing protein n=1 Tax=Shewanella avicenniae TaxID=2814294 RepID=A0ABX7QUB3_9GAMM|nr:EAL domain-containing protein [Shewanella avicenniae]QSX35086.1 EAL domain-containing protein [Shewanella avicenniae]
MSLSTKFLIAVLFVFLAGFGLIQLLMYHHIKHETEQELLESADRVRSVLMSVRRIYQHQFLESGLPLNHDTIGFLPAHALGKISRDLSNWNNSGFSFNNVSDQPRNPLHAADAVEQQAIDFFRRNPTVETHFMPFENAAGELFYHYAKPIWVEAYCLNCHGSKATAPETIKDTYDSAYDYKVGDLRGIISIKVPGKRVKDSIKHMFGIQLGWMGASSVLVALIVLWLLRRNVIKPLGSLREAMRQIQIGSSHGPMLLNSLPREFIDIAKTFNEMTSSMASKDTALIESELRYRKLVQLAQEGVIQTDAKGNIAYWNKGAEKIFGYSEKEIQGKPISVLVPYDSRAKHHAGMQSTFDSSMQPFVGKIVEVPALRKNGSEIRVELSITSWMMKYDAVYVAVIRDVTERKQAEEQIRHLAFYDSLTNLPNRRMLMDQFRIELETSVETGQYGAVLMADLDNFKALNDTCGHGMGDLLLIEVARRMKNAVSASHTVARLGGDEFIILMDSLGTDRKRAYQEALDIARTVKSRILQPYRLASELTDYSCTVSIGVALFQGDKESIDMLMTHVDMALYKAKDAGRDVIKFFDNSIQQEIAQRHVIESALRRAESLNQFVLYYQPQTDANGRLVGTEALIRWFKEDNKMVSPGEFIPVAEQSGLIEMIGSWVINAACLQIVAWEAAGIPPEIKVAVNVSAHQFGHVNFVSELLMSLSITGADPSRLKIELTESAILQDIEVAKEKILRLKAAGIRFSLDDFGTGYSSLSYLKQLPVDQLKIDQSFVRDITEDESDAAIVQAILAICVSLDIEAIAEGVETEEQLQFLLKHGCRRFQGYFFGKPMPACELEELFFTDLKQKIIS